MAGAQKSAGFSARFFLTRKCNCSSSDNQIRALFGCPSLCPPLRGTGNLGAKDVRRRSRAMPSLGKNEKTVNSMGFTCFSLNLGIAS